MLELYRNVYRYIFHAKLLFKTRAINCPCPLRNTFFIKYTLIMEIIFLLKVVTEYERAVIFRLGRLRKGGSKGPGIFTVIPCIDTYRCVDLRTVSFDVPPQEASITNMIIEIQNYSYFKCIESIFSEIISYQFIIFVCIK